jgi:hypothetical protein
LLLHFARSAAKLRFCLRLAPADCFDQMVSERNSLDGALVRTLIPY